MLLSIARNYMAQPSDPRKIHKRSGRLIKGMVIGGAIGSILGMTLAPKTGKETRQILKEKSSGLFGGFFRGMKALIKGRKEKK